MCSTQEVQQTRWDSAWQSSLVDRLRCNKVNITGIFPQTKTLNRSILVNKLYAKHRVHSSTRLQWHYGRQFSFGNRHNYTNKASKNELICEIIAYVHFIANNLYCRPKFIKICYICWLILGEEWQIARGNFVPCFRYCPENLGTVEFLQIVHVSFKSTNYIFLFFYSS